MAKLICTLDDRIVGEYALDKDRISIGRRNNNDIVIDNLAVSGVHAYIAIIGVDAFLEDANSTNGTNVNAKPVKKHLLAHGDVIEIGRHQFRFLNDKSPLKSSAVAKPQPTPLAHTPTQPPSLKSLIQLSQSNKQKQSDQREAVIDKLSKTTPIPIEALPSTLPTSAKLEILNGSNKGKHLTLNKTLTTIGKEGLQRVVITKRSNGFFLGQIEGDEKVSINGKPLNVLSYELKPKDEINISGVKMLFTF